MSVKTTEDRFAEIVAEVGLRVEAQSKYDWTLQVNNEVLSVMRCITLKVARMEEEGG